MERQDRDAIETLFGKLADVERQGLPRDPEADRFIQERLAQQPGAAYYMAQTIVMQEQALNAAQQRLEAAERAEPAEERSGGFLGGLFGGGSGERERRATVPSIGGSRGAVPSFGRQGAAGQAAQAGRGGGGFLAGAAQTAMGVAGGILLGNAIAGLFDGPEAGAGQVADADAGGAADAGGEAGGQDAGYQDAGFDGGGDMGGDFDLDI